MRLQFDTRQNPAARSSQEAIKISPPTGASAPSHEIPVTASIVRDPLKTNMPRANPVAARVNLRSVHLNAHNPASSMTTACSCKYDVPILKVFKWESVNISAR